MNTPEQILFMVDHMLLKLGNYLRILGYDAIWDSAIRTHELILRANREHRVFLTRNTRLAEPYPAVNRVPVLTDTNPVEQLHHVVNAFVLDTTSFLFSKCIRCNLALKAVVDYNEIRHRVHPNVLTRYDKLYQCPRCDTVFWKGTHVCNTCRKLKLETKHDEPRLHGL
jgi:uncharacterized protein with PIN domain